jgi:hypothetical protein
MDFIELEKGNEYDFFSNCIKKFSIKPYDNILLPYNKDEISIIYNTTLNKIIKSNNFVLSLASNEKENEKENESLINLGGVIKLFSDLTPPVKKEKIEEIKTKQFIFQINSK